MIKTVYILSLILIIGCSKRLPTKTQTVTITTEVKIIERDTLVSTRPDSTYYHAWIRCVDDKPVMQEVSKSGFQRALKPPDIFFKDTLLIVKCKVDSQQVFVKWKERHVVEQYETFEREYVSVVKELSWWQKLWIGLGKGVAGFLGLFIIYSLIRWRLKNFF